MKSILELLDFICIAHNFNVLLLVWLQHSVALDYFPDALLVLREGSVLSWDLGLVFYCYPISVVFEYFNIIIVQFMFIDKDNRSSRCSEYSNHEWNMIALDLNIKRDSDSGQNFCFQCDLNGTGALRSDDG